MKQEVKKELSREEKGEIIALKLHQSRQLYNYWLRISRMHHMGKDIHIEIEEKK